MPNIYATITAKCNILKRLLGVKSAKSAKENVGTIDKGETLLVNVGSTAVGGEIVKIEKDYAIRFKLRFPVCTEIGEIIAISRRINASWR